MNGKTLRRVKRGGLPTHEKGRYIVATEYRVVWKRVGLAVKRKRYATIKAARRLMTRMTDMQPWVRDGKDPDAFYCCAGTVYDECACGGLTVREEAEARIAEYPALEYMRLERREVGNWLNDPLTRGMVGDSSPPSPHSAGSNSPNAVVHDVLEGPT